MKKSKDRKRFVICTIGALAIVICCLAYLMHYRSFNLISIGVTDNVEVKREQYAFRKNREDGSLWYQVEINYPQLLNSSESDGIERINALLRDAAFSVYENTYDEAIAYLKELEDGDRYVASVVNKYDILQLSNDYISILFEVESFSASVHTHHYFATIDVNKGEYVGLNDLANRSQLIDLIESGNFEVIEGMYSELHGDYFHQPEVIASFVEMLKSELDNHDLSDGYDNRCQNIGMDEENLYLHFYYDVSLDGYVLLRVPWEWE